MFIFFFSRMFFSHAMHKSFLLKKKKKVGRIEELFGGLVGRIRRFHRHGSGSVPAWWTDILQVVWYAKKKAE